MRCYEEDVNCEVAHLNELVWRGCVVANVNEML